MKKRIFALTVVALLSLSMVGYSFDEPEDVPEPTHVHPSETVNAPSNTGRSLATIYSDGRDFSDGFAWVRENNIWHLINTRGEIVLSLGADDRPISDFSHGVALVVRNASVAVGNANRELIDRNGRVISSPTLGGYDQICTFIPEMGMAIVYKRVVTFEATEHRFGIINSNGDWVLPLTNNNALFNAVFHSQNMLHMNNFNNRDYFRYFGEGIILYLDHKRHNRGPNLNMVDMYFYNVLTNDSFVVENITTPLRTIISNMDNGYGLISTSNHPNIRICSINRTWQMNELFSFSIGGTIGFPHLGNYSEGLFFYNDYNNHSRQGFYNINGNLVIDLSEYTIDLNDVYNIRFTNGYCLLNLFNPQGDLFYTIIDTNGNLMFEPRRREGTVSQKSNGLFALRQNGQHFLINAFGETVLDLGTIESISDFNEGIARVRTRNGIYYILAPGSIIAETIQPTITPTPVANNINVVVNGNPVIFDQPPINQDGRTLVPLRAIFEALGASIDWNGDTQTVTAVRGDVTVSLTIGSNILNRNSEQITLDVPAQLVNGRTMVPARAVAESFGAEVGWEQSTQTVTINTTGQSPTPSITSVLDWETIFREYYFSQPQQWWDGEELIKLDGYVFDIDGDGTPELLISRGVPDSGWVWLDVYQLQNGGPVRIGAIDFPSIFNGSLIVWLDDDLFFVNIQNGEIVYQPAPSIIYNQLTQLAEVALIFSHDN